jgi:hypothetical protein
MLLVMPKLLYFGITGQFCAVVQLREPSAGKGPCELEDQLTFGIFTLIK